MIFAPLYEVDRDAGSASVRRAVASFLKSGDRGETHSHRGLLLHHILNHCVENRIGFVLEFDPARGYLVRRRSA